jgi:hypothetical protein
LKNIFEDSTILENNYFNIMNDFFIKNNMKFDLNKYLNIYDEYELCKLLQYNLEIQDIKSIASYVGDTLPVFNYSILENCEKCIYKPRLLIFKFNDLNTVFASHSITQNNNNIKQLFSKTDILMHNDMTIYDKDFNDITLEYNEIINSNSTLIPNLSYFTNLSEKNCKKNFAKKIKLCLNDIDKQINELKEKKILLKNNIDETLINYFLTN